MDAKTRKQLAMFVKNLRSRATTAERIYAANLPGKHGENRAGDESFKVMLSAESARWTYIEVANELEHILTSEGK